MSRGLLRRVAAMAALLAAASGFASCAKARPAAEPGVPTVVAAPVGGVELADELSSFGTISFTRKAELSATADGVVAKLPFREGDKVPSGALVAALSNAQYELARLRALDGISQAEAALELAEARLFEGRLAVEARLVGVEKAELELEQSRAELADEERKFRDKETLFAAGGVAEEELRQARLALASRRVGIALQEKDLDVKRIGFRDSDLSASGLKPGRDDASRRAAFVELNTATLRAERNAAKAALASARKELSSAELAIRDLSVASPVSGVLGARFVEEGERAKAGDKLVVVMDTRKVHAVVPVRENEAGRLAPGMRATIRVDALGGREFAASVDVVSPSADPGVGAFTVKLLADNPLAVLKPGMFARATIVLGKPAVVAAVPPEVLVARSGNRARALVVAGGRASWRDLETGREVDGLVAVAGGLSRGELVVLRPDPSIEEGSRVEISK